MDDKTKAFLADYQALCELHGMYIDYWSNESGTDIGVNIEQAMSEEELKEHFNKSF